LTKEEKASQLRESFAKKVQTVTALRKDIENLEVSSLPPREFGVWVKQRKKQLESEFPEAQKALQDLELEQKGELQDFRRQIRELNDEEESLENKATEEYIRRNPDSWEEADNDPEWGELLKCLSPEDRSRHSQLTEQIDELNHKIQLLEEKQRRILSRSENPFLYTSLRFLDDIEIKKEQVTKLHEAHLAGVEEFSRKVFVIDLREYITAKGNSIKVEFTPYEVVFYITKDEADEFFRRANPGWHYPNTPICVVIEREQERQDYTRTHEIGHNRMECAEVAGVHEITYAEATVRLLKKRMQRLRDISQLRAPQSVLKDSEYFIQDQIRNQLMYLNGEISADAENIVQGRFSSFYFHFVNTASALEKLAESPRGSMGDEVTKMVEEEVGKLEAKTASHLREVLFFSHLARKYHKEDEFYSILVMDPDSPRLLRRLFSEELGDTYQYEKQIDSLIPEVNLPEIIHQRLYDIHKRSRGPREFLRLKPGGQTLNMIPPNKPLPSEHDWRKWSHYSDFEYVFTEEYCSTNIFSPKKLPHFLEVIKKRPAREIDERAIIKIHDLFEDYVGNSRFFSIFDSTFFPEDASGEAWRDSVNSVKEYEAQLCELSEYVGQTVWKEPLSKSLYETTVYKALKVSVVSDNPEPLKQVFDHWKVDLDTSEYFSQDGEFLHGYDVANWFDEGTQELAEKYLTLPEQTKVYQYLLSACNSQTR